MREIKFRAWDKVCKYMINPESEKHFKLYLNGSMSIGGCWSTKDLTLMQYTGLKDKNGKEIYEGDILQNSESIHFVKYFSGAFGLYYKDERKEPYYESLLGYVALSDYFKGKIIGNIYENPELIAVDKVGTK